MFFLLFSNLKFYFILILYCHVIVGIKCLAWTSRGKADELSFVCQKVEEIAFSIE